MRARPPQRADEHGALVEQPARTLGLEREQLPQRGTRRRSAQVGRLDAEAPPVLRRQVDAPAAEVLADVLPVLRELQRRADAVRERDPLRRRRAEDVQHELADRIRREVAVVHELVERLVRRLPLVATVRLDQTQERLARERALAHGRPQALQQRVLRLAVEDAVQILLERVEDRGAVAVDLVAELVDEPREAVDRREVSARLAPDEQRGDGEVLARRQRQDRGRIR